MNNALLKILNGCEVRSITSAAAITNRAHNFTLDDFVDSVNNAKTIDDLNGVCSSIRDHYGFDFFALLIRFNRVNDKPICYVIREFDNQWSNYYQQNNCLYYDPGIRISVNRVTPFWWSGNAFDDLKNILTAPEFNHCERAFDFGMRDVLNAPFAGKSGEYGLIRFVRFEAGQASVADVKINRHKIPELYYLASHIYQSLIRILIEVAPKFQLSEREKDILLWTAQGKNPANIADNLHISENTVCKHLSNVREKLNVRNTTHAVAKAISAGEINP